MKSLKRFYLLKTHYLKNHYFTIRHASNIQNSKSYALSTFEGNIDTTQLFPYPKVLSNEQEETLKQMIGPINKFFEETNNSAKNDELGSIEPRLFQGLKELGVFGLQVPEEYGGLGLNNTQYGRIFDIILSYDIGIGITLGSHQSIGFKGIMLYGTEEQKTKYLPSLASGQKLAAYCLTESSAGSDAQAIQLKAVKSPDGSHYILNGSKLWISNGGIADVFTVFAKTNVVDEKGVEKEKITAFIVERGFGGISHSPPEKKMGIKCSNTAALFFEDCKVPAENVLGGEGQGFKVAMNILNNGRFSVAAGLAGTMRSCIQKAVNHAIERKTFGNKIHTYGTIQEKIIRMVMKQYVTESIAFVVAGNMDRGLKEFQVEAAISKVYATDAAWYCCDEAIQILGGMGYMKECGLERILRDLRIFRIFEGSNEILKMFLVGQGLTHLGSVLKNAETEAKQKIGVGSSIDSSKLLETVHPKLHQSVHTLCSTIGLFLSYTQSLLIEYKKNIHNQQFHLIRLAECAMEIYAMSVVLSRATSALNNNESTKEYQAKLAELTCSLSSEKVTENIDQMKRNGKENFTKMASLSDEICSFGGVIQSNPLGF